jgi:hypothetical protein
LRNPHAGSEPLALAHADLTIARPALDSVWPLGTRGVATPEPETSVALAESVLALRRDSLPPLRVLVAPRDPRDLLGDGIDLLLTRDPAALAYAATLPEFESVPLEWQRTRVLLSPRRTPITSPLPEDARQQLAEDAIRGEARGAVGPFWWETAQDCDTGSGLRPAPTSQPPLTPRLVYDSSDAAARDLAERLVAIARSAGPAAPAIANALLSDRARRDYQRAAALTGEPLVQARKHGDDAGYLMSLDRRPLEPCREWMVAIEELPWLDRDTIVPLADTRLHAIVRRGRAGVAIDWDGGIVLAGADRHP